MDVTGLKKDVKDFWSENPCGSDTTQAAPGTKAYFDQIEQFRYREEPQILSFARFPDYKDKEVLEVGVGLGTDFTQWVRAGAKATGVDLTETGINNVKNRLSLYGLKAHELRVADCENLPFKDNSFDLVYSWGVIMHTPDTPRALSEIIRVIRPGGKGKLMVYNKHSLGTFYLWFRYALLKGRPWKSFSWCAYHYQESKGTKVYSRGEIEKMLAPHPVTGVQINAWLTNFDRLSASQKGPVRLFGRLVSTLFGRDRYGWHMVIEFQKKEAST